MPYACVLMLSRVGDEDRNGLFNVKHSKSGLANLFDSVQTRLRMPFTVGATRSRRP
jgi:hypothetical protein